MTDHHKFNGFCTTRLPYRSGNIPRAVKTYTISDESVYLLIFNIPSINVIEELARLLNQFGKILQFEKVEHYPGPIELFSEVLMVKYKNLKSAKVAKNKMDNYSFMGNVLHVCYAPEYENLDETRLKLSTHANFVRNFSSQGSANRRKFRKTRNDKKKSNINTNDEKSSSTSTISERKFDNNEKQSSGPVENFGISTPQKLPLIERSSKYSIRTSRPRLKLKLR
uniref:RNA-binding protein 48 n=1 Tax=Romanomermis culicivorax TaxID=13658 RepID=A0A915JT65_ROMCU